MTSYLFMKNKLRNGIALSLIPQIIVVKWLAGHSDWIESFYSTGIYPWISEFFRYIFGWVPFSIGEIIYTILIVLVFRYIIQNRKKIKTKPFSFLRDIAMILSVFYFTFHLVWGLNYYRQPLSETMALKDKASYEEIKNLTETLVARTNALQLRITKDSTQMVQVPYTYNEIFKKTITSYNALDGSMPYLAYRRPSVKKSMFSKMSSYMGIGGYLNPFTNEAQVNKKTPVFRFPVVAAHEIGHQIGYAAENETNLIGYIVTQKNKDIYFQYSASAYALAYCLNAVHGTDKKEFEVLYARINEGVKKNYRELQNFHKAYENPFEPIFKSVFSTFLKANNQADGVKSYSRVVHLMVGYHEKYPL